MRYFITIAGALAVALASSCSGHGDADIASAPDTLDIKSNSVLIADDALIQPQTLYATSQNLVVVNSPGCDSLVSLYSLSGSHSRNLLRKGNGPEEVAFIYSSYIDAGADCLMLTSAPGSLSSLNLTAGAQPPLLTKAFTYDPATAGTPDSLNLNMELFRMAGGTILAGVQSPEGYFAIFRPDGRFDRYAVTPIPESDFGEGFPDYMKYNFCRPVGAVSPDGRHFACYFGGADMMAFASLEADSLTFKVNYDAPPRGIKIKIGDGWSAFEYDDTHCINYPGRPCLSNSHVYVRYVGLPDKEAYARNEAMTNGDIPPSTLVRIYDFNRTLRRVINLDCMALSIAVSPDDSTLYALTESADSGYSCITYALPPID